MDQLYRKIRTKSSTLFYGHEITKINEILFSVMVLNALDVDPGKIWKAPWRFYHETMLQCCVPLDIVKIKGITLPQFYCLAKCNRLNVDLHYGDISAGDISVSSLSLVYNKIMFFSVIILMSIFFVIQQNLKFILN